MYRMVYEDDPTNILTLGHHIDRGNGNWVLDDETHELISTPQLTIVHLNLVQSHILLIPYHEHSKFMHGIIDQKNWGQKFVTYSAD